MKNEVYVSGIITSVEFDHEIYGEQFYLINLCVNRLSGSSDSIPVMVSNRSMLVAKEDIGKYVTVVGQFRSHQKEVDGRKKLFLYVFAEEISLNKEGTTMNMISIEGNICKVPTFRQTPLGRQISDVFIAVNRQYGKSDYIPCIIWGRNAKFASHMKVGDSIRIQGRVQSREYMKDNQTHLAYEVSANIIEYAS